MGLRGPGLEVEVLPGCGFRRGDLRVQRCPILDLIEAATLEDLAVPDTVQIGGCRAAAGVSGRYRQVLNANREDRRYKPGSFRRHWPARRKVAESGHPHEMKEPKPIAPNDLASEGSECLRSFVPPPTEEEAVREDGPIGHSPFAARALDLVRAVVVYRAGSLFDTRRDALKLVASVGFDQAALDHAEAIWTSQRRLLIDGQLVVQRLAAVGRMPLRHGGIENPGCVVVLPVRERNRPLLGFLYLDGQPDDLQTPAAADLLGRLSPLLVLAFEPWPEPEPFIAGVPSSTLDERARALQLLEQHDWNASGVAKAMGLSRPGLDVRLARLGVQREKARAVADESERARLVAHLAQNEWNVARVARILGTARGTIYTRMAQLGIQRQRVRKSPPSRRVRPPA